VTSNAHTRFLTLLSAGLLSTGFAIAAPETQPDQAAEPAAAAAAEAPASAPLSTVDRAANTARSSVRAATLWVARGVDSWFGDRPFEDGGRVSDGLLRLSLLKREGDSLDFDVRLNARFKLPNVEESTYVFFGRDDPQEVLTDRPGGLSRQEQLQAQSNSERQFFAGLGRVLNDEIDFRVGFRGGLKLYGQARYRKQWEIGDDGLAEFRQVLFWSSSDRFGSTTAFSYEHLFSSVWAARSLTSATITQKSERFEWASLLGAYRSFGNQKLLSLEALINGVQGAGAVTTDYGLQTRWEQPVYKDWLIGGIVVGHFWPRPDEQSQRADAWALGVSLKMRF